ncbi:MAG: trypsin-like peptidase domain-containing protein [Myxococcota bacterium]|nr:trypsin-like peptidase domain-containing protein [Myxococcota bacterium]
MTRLHSNQGHRRLTRYRWIIGSFILAIGPAALAQSLTVQAHPTHITSAENVHLIVRVSAATQPALNQPSLSGWSIDSQTQTQSKRTQGERVQYTLVYEYSLRPTRAAPTQIPSFAARADAWSSKSQPIVVHVHPPDQAPTQVASPTGVSSKPATTQRANFSPIFEQVSPGVVGLAAGRIVDGRFRPSNRGTGLVWDHDGHVVTSAHLLINTSEVRLRRQDGSVSAAMVIGRDVATDVALLRVDGLDLTPIPRRSSDHRIRPGQWVAAVGNPYGMAQSITVGVVSAIGRRNLPKGAPKYGDFIQTDVAIFPGNSGGPLVDEEGKVIGLNTAILDNSLSFSTGIQFVEFVVGRLKVDGRFERGFGGLYLKPLTQGLARALGLVGGTGARVRAVVKGGPAELAGLRPSDVIVAVDGAFVEGPDAFAWTVAKTRPMRTLKLAVMRDGQPLDIQLVVGEVPD